MPSTVSPKQAAIEAGCLAQQVYGAIAAGKLKVRRVMGRILIDRASFDTWKANLETHRTLRASR